MEKQRLLYTLQIILSSLYNFFGNKMMGSHEINSCTLTEVIPFSSLSYQILTHYTSYSSFASF